VEVNEHGLKPKIGLARTAGMNPGFSTAMDAVVEEVAIPRRSAFGMTKGGLVDSQNGPELRRFFEKDERKGSLI
jgi:hypothetical protein